MYLWSEKVCAWPPRGHTITYLFSQQTAYFVLSFYRHISRFENRVYKCNFSILTMSNFCMPPFCMLHSLNRSAIFPVCFLISLTVSSFQTFSTAAQRLLRELTDPEMLATRVLRICHKGSIGLRSGDLGVGKCLDANLWPCCCCNLTPVPRCSILHHQHLMSPLVLHLLYKVLQRPLQHLSYILHTHMFHFLTAVVVRNGFQMATHL